MSWRTKGFYTGLSDAATDWLQLFNAKWDTKAEGRTRDDAFDHMRDECSPTAIKPKSHRKRPQLQDLVGPEPAESTLENEIALLAQEVQRFTVPKQTRRGWSIHLVLKSGEKIRVPFLDRASAQQAYQALKDASSMVKAA